MNKKLLKKKNKPIEEKNLIDFGVLFIEGLQKYAQTPHQMVALFNALSIYMIRYLQDFGVVWNKVDQEILISAFNWLGEHNKLFGEAVLKVLSEQKKIDSNFEEQVLDLFSKMPAEFKTQVYKDK